MNVVSGIRAVALTTILFGSASQPAVAEPAVAPADLILLNGRVYTVTADEPWVEAMAVRDGRILARGSDADMTAWRGTDTQVMDLGGRMVMPGIIDGHQHPVWGGIKELFECNFPFTATPAEIAAIVTACVAAQPDSAWIIGGQWTSNFFVDNQIPSPRRWLDEVSGGKAVILADDSGHNRWANSRALELMGITKDTADPAGSKIGREPGGNEPNGILEEAISLVKTTVPEWTLEQNMRGAAYALTAANRFGITGIKDASADPTQVEAFYRLDQAEGLTANVATALNASAHNNFDDDALREYVRLRDQFASPHVHTAFVKIFLDGVPTASRTAAMLEPYLPLHKGDPAVYGDLHLEPAQLAAAVTKLDKLGFTVKIHAAGDRSIRVALDAIAQARKTNGNSGLRHELAHAEFIADSDLPRFASLDVVADFSPYIWFPSPITDSIDGALGKRSEPFFPARSLIDSGAPMLAGSDWPSAVPDMNPWTGMEALITRSDPQGEYPGVSWQEQAISLEQAIDMFTISGAQALKLDHQTGSLAVGKSADFIVLEDNLFEIAPSRISDTRVRMTFFEGKLVYVAADRDANGVPD